MSISKKKKEEADKKKKKKLLISFFVKIFWIKKKIKWVSGRVWISLDNIFGKDLGMSTNGY